MVGVFAMKDTLKTIEVKDVKETLSRMGKGAQRKFCIFMVDKKMYQTINGAKCSLEYYSFYKGNSRSFLKRQEVVDAFFEYVGKYLKFKKRDFKNDVIVKYNQKLSKIWDAQCTI